MRQSCCSFEKGTGGQEGTVSHASSNELVRAAVFWPAKAKAFKREKHDVEKGKPGFSWLAKKNLKKKLAGGQGICYE